MAFDGRKPDGVVDSVADSELNALNATPFIYDSNLIKLNALCDEITSEITNKLAQSTD